MVTLPRLQTVFQLANHFLQQFSSGGVLVVVAGRKNVRAKNFVFSKTEPKPGNQCPNSDTYRGRSAQSRRVMPELK